MLADIVAIYGIIILGYFLVLNMYYIVLLFFATERLFYHKIKRHIHHYREYVVDDHFSFLHMLFLNPRLFTYSSVQHHRILREKLLPLAPSISILAPAYNEVATIIESVKSLLEIDYPELEIIVINDGSNDETLQVLQDEFRLFPATRACKEQIPTKPVRCVYRSAVVQKLIVLDKENGGKADALNTGINYARSRLFCAIDADSLIEKDALQKLIESYLERKAKVVAIGGIVRVANGCRIKNSEVIEARIPRSYIPAIQAMEYIRAFLIGRAGWSKINSLLIISGAFGLFDRKAVMESGGYLTTTVGEDMEMVVRLHRIMSEQGKAYEAQFLPDPVCWTEVPDSLRVLGRQRNRWHRGLMETMQRHRRMIGNPKYRFAGLLGMPYFFFFEMLGPTVEVSGYIVVVIALIMGWVNIQFALLFLLLAIIFGVIISLFSLLLEEFTNKRYERPFDIVKLFFLAVIENFGYRQLNSWWRFRATIDFLRKKKSWGEMQRKGFSTSG